MWNADKARAESLSEERKLATDLSGYVNRIGKIGVQMVSQTLEISWPGQKDCQDKERVSFIYTLTTQSCEAGDIMDNTVCTFPQ